MASRLIVLVVALAACQAKPVWFVENGPIPGTLVYRDGRALEFEQPSFAFGLGSGFSSKIGGISHSNSFGTSFEYGGGQASGFGAAGTDGNGYARGAGYANARPSAPSIYRNAYPYGYSPYDAYRHNNGAAISSAQNFGGLGTAVAQAHNSPFGSAAAAVHQSGISSAQSIRGFGPYGATVSSATTNGFGSAIAASSGGQGTAISTTQSRDGLGYNTAAAASQNVGGYKASTAHTVQQDGRGVQQSSATSIDGPGIQTANAVNTGYY